MKIDSLPGTEEAPMEEGEEFEKASKLTGPVSIFIDHKKCKDSLMEKKVTK